MSGGRAVRMFRAAAAAGVMALVLAEVGPVAADSGPPDTSVASPAASQALPLAPATLAGSATDDAGVAAVRLAIRDRSTLLWWQADGSWGPWATHEAVLAAPGATSTGWSFEWQPPASGDYGLWARAEDTAANADPSPAWVVFSVAPVVDAAAPETVVSVPAPDAVVALASVGLAGSASDDTGVAAVRLAIRDRSTLLWWQADGSWGPWATHEAVLAAPGATSTGWSFEWQPPASGDYGLWARAEDVAGRVDPSPGWRNFTVAPEGVFVPPRYERTIGFPGHAEVYAWGMATATNGDLLVGDYLNYVVRRYAPDGTLLASFAAQGTGPGRNAEPYGLAVSPVDGAVYVADPINYEIDKWSADGAYLTSLDIDPFVSGRPYNPRLAVNEDGWVYVVNSHNAAPVWDHQLIVFDGDLNFLFRIGQTGSGPGEFLNMRGVDVGPDGNVYVVDQGNRRVSVWAADGTFLRQFGAAGWGPGLLGGDLRGIAVDARHVYVVDASANEIEKYELDGTYVATLRTPGGTGASQPAPAGDREVTIGRDGNLYVADFANYRVNVLTTTGALVGTLPDPPVPPPPGGFNAAEDVAVNRTTGAIYVADTNNNRVQQFGPLGGFVRTWGFRGGATAYGMDYPRGIAVDQANGNVWLNNTRKGNIKAYTATGTFIRSFGSWGAGDDEFFYSRGIWAGADGLMYFGDAFTRRVKVTDQAGAFQWSVRCGRGSDDTNGGILAGCSDVTLDAEGNVYAVAPTEHVVNKYDAAGVLLMQWGTPRVPGSAPGELDHPYGIAIDGDRAYVTDMGNHRVCVFDLAGVVLGCWGGQGSGHGQFVLPKGIDVDAAGRVYVVDAGNERLEVFAP